MCAEPVDRVRVRSCPQGRGRGWGGRVGQAEDRGGGGCGPVAAAGAAARGRGYADDEVRRLVRTGELSPVRRGAYLRGRAARRRGAARHAGPRQSRAGAARRRRGGEPRLGRGAARAAGVGASRCDRVHVTRARRSGGRVQPPGCTCTPRRWSRTRSCVRGRAAGHLAWPAPWSTWPAPCRFEAGGGVADAALQASSQATPRCGRWTRRSCAARWPGRRAGRATAGGSTGRSRSPTGAATSVGESRSRVAHRAGPGCPRRSLQWEVRDARRPVRRPRPTSAGPSCARSGEFDGRIKYGRLLRPGSGARATWCIAEKLREDAPARRGPRTSSAGPGPTSPPSPPPRPPPPPLPQPRRSRPATHQSAGRRTTCRPVCAVARACAVRSVRRRGRRGWSGPGRGGGWWRWSRRGSGSPGRSGCRR